MHKTLKGAILLALAGMVASNVGAQTLTGADVGAPSNPGSMTLADGKYTIVGGGSDIWGTADNFYYAYFNATGDFDYVCKVESLTGNTGDAGWSKVELMARLDDGSGIPQGGDPFIANMTTRPSSDTPTEGSGGSVAAGVNYRGPQWRAVRDDQCTWTQPTPAYPPNMPNNWMRLERVGNVFYMYTSNDGTTWNMYNPYDPQGWDTSGSWPPGTDNPAVAFFSEAWPATCMLGIAVTAHSDADISTAVVSQFGPYTQKPISITTQPPATVSVAQNNKLELKVAATGDPVHYQWRKDGTPIARAVGATYTVALAKLSDAGTYTCRVFQGGSKEIISSASVVTVTVDTQPPTVLSAKADISFTRVIIQFSEPVTASALTKGNYAIDKGVTVNSVAQATPSSVVLTTSKLAEGETYTVTINNVQDSAIPANTIAANTTVTFKSFVYAAGFASYERWDNANNEGAADPSLADFVTSIAEGTIRAPDVTASVTQFGGPWGASDYYSSRVSGYFIPPSDGDYVFFLASDDGSYLFLSSDDQPANKKIIAYESGWSNQYQWQTIGGGSTIEQKRSDLCDVIEWETYNTITLQAGKKYYIEILEDEGSGGDGSDATFIKSGESDPAQSAAGMFLKGNVIGTYLDPTGASVDIVQQPKDATGAQNTSVTFTVDATGTSAYGTTVSYQWQSAPKDSSTFTDIAGATAATYVTPLVSLADDGKQFRVNVSVPTLTVPSSVAKLTVSSDSTPPTVVSAGAFAGASSVGVAFDELVDATSATATGNYTISGATISSAVLRFGKYVELKLAGAVSAGFTVTVNSVKDLVGNTMASQTVTGEMSDMVSQDIGDPGVDPLQPGDALSFGHGHYWVAGGGHDIWDNADGFHFVYKEFTGPFEMSARINMNANGPDTTTTWAKAELMVRESTAAGSRHNSVCTTRAEGENAIEGQWRDATDGASGNLRVLTPVPYPNNWIKLVREDATQNEIKIYTGIDGVNWTLENTHTTTGAVLPEKILVGMAVTSHDNTGTDILAEGMYEFFTVESYAVIVDPQLMISMVSGQPVVTWLAGTLVASPTVLGEYIPVDGAVSPYTVAPGANIMFYKVKR